MELDYQTIFTELNKERIHYVVVGGLAVNFHGIPRMTYHIDLIIGLDTENIMKTVTRLKSWGTSQERRSKLRIWRTEKRGMVGLKRKT